ncbi:ABC transporter permease [Alkalibacillus aidingensis]|uniref:ABC transporter permease n=1 Tax=Alkalibacillus aidingensis TaxID=2747607 RepID=UPI001660C20C|nr:ABC transporter permease [Alkalibacillus aidingensis]
MDTNQLWKDRLNNHLKMVSRYMRLIFNDHLAFALIFFVAAFAFFYQQWLETVPNTFPVAWIMAVLIGSLLTYSPVRTFFKEADTVFLLTVENRLKPYIRNSVIYSFVMQSYWVAIFLFALSPLYFTVYEQVAALYLLVVLIVALAVKVGNLLATWFIGKTRDTRLHYLDIGVRFVINVFLVFFLAIGQPAYAIVAVALIVGVMFLNYWNVYTKYSLPWDDLIEKEDARLQFFYRIANLSTDVPDLKRKPKKRHGLVSLVTRRMPTKQSQTFIYLYSITFIRSGDYFGMYLRLLLLAIFFVFWIPAFWGKIIFAMLFLFITGFQFITIYNHHRTIDWVRLYPVSQGLRKKAVHQLILMLMFLKIIIMAVIFLVATDWMGTIIYGGLAVAFAVLFEAFYVKSRIRKLGT